MYFNDHDPPHFHAVYNEWRAQIGIRDLRLIEGELPPKALGLTLEWAMLHRSELLGSWESLRSNGTFGRIEPLV
jgi:hypothetical protein